MFENLKAEVFDWCEKNHWKGYDPFDGLNTPLQKIVGRGLWAIGLLQLVKRCPFNIRPLLFISPHENPMSWAAGILGAVEGKKEDFLRRGCRRLLELQTPGTDLWGYPFSWASKAFYLKKGEPNLVLSALCLRALRRAPLSEEQKRRTTQSLQALHTRFYKSVHGFFSYVAHDTILVHNANLLGAEAAAYSPSLQTDAFRALTVSLQAQEASGRWPYGSLPHHRWCDNFHTAYNLISLADLYSTFPKAEVEQAIRKGLNYYLSHAFSREGLCRYYDDQISPLESHTAAVALICLKEMTRKGWMKKEQAQPLAEKICAGLRRDFYLGGGKFLYRRGRLLKTKTVFTRWTQAWVYAGLEAADSLVNS